MFSPYSSNSRNSPLPNFSFAESKEVWELMMVKDEQYVRNPAVLLRHPSLEARMRAILFDWMSEVSEVYKLHRETFYLAVDFVDRYLAAQTGIPKAQLQLVGITCLFIASKIEEIYPPKLSEFAYVTDGLCSEEEMLIKELVILKSLKWDLTPMTPNCWLAMYMQLYSRLEKENRASKSCKGGAGDAFMVPGYPSIFFVQIAHLLDLSMLDIGVLRFSYSVVAAAALYHFTSEEVVYQCTGLRLEEIRDCVLWMTPFALAIRDEGFENPKLQRTPDATASLHNIMSHTVDIPLLEKAHLKQRQDNSLNYDDEDSKSSTSCIGSSSGIDPGPSTFLTPPRSGSKGCGDGLDASLNEVAESSTSRRADKRRREPLFLHPQDALSVSGRKNPRKKSPSIA